MSDMKCPVCGGDMIAGGICHYNPDCPIHDQNVPIEVLELLERTRKALDAARSGLEYIFGYEGVPKYVAKHIRQVLDQIKNETELEQITALTKGGDNE